MYIINFISEMLENHRKMCEKSGNYVGNKKNFSEIYLS